MKVIVFDLGGTLMQYVGMPHSWVEFYYQGFDAIRRKFGYKVTEDEIERSIQRLTEMNPRVNYREEEYLPEEMFAKALAHWSGKLPIAECVKVFWDGLELSAELMGHFDYYVSSAVSGVRKPNDGGLRMIAEKFGVPLAELVLVGDEDKDAGTAERAGCRFVRIDRNGEREGSIRGLEELLEKLKCFG